MGKAEASQTMSAVRKPGAILFDMGGTLLREESYDLPAGILALCKDPRLAEALSGGGAERLLSELSTEISRVHGTNSADFTVLRWLGDRFPGRRAAELEELELVLWNGAASLHAMPGAEAALEELGRSGIRMAVVSNAVFCGRRTILAELHRHGLASFLESVISSADLGVRKPDPAIFHEALRRLDVPAVDAWFVGDSWAMDVVGAAAAGVAPFWFGDSKAPPGSALPHGQVRTWSDFMRHFRLSASTP